jgi:hypothetical protein
MTTLESIGIDPQSHGYAASEILLAGKLSKLIAYTKELEERLNGLEGMTHVVPKGDFDPMAWEGVLERRTHYFDPAFPSMAKSVVTESP